MSRLAIDRFTWLILGAVLFSILLPAHGQAVAVLRWVQIIGVAALFFLYGARLSTPEALAGLKHWRLHLVILMFTFLVFPVIGLGLSLLPPQILSPELYVGMLYCTLVPSTVQSSITFTSIARGNVAAALVSASASNLLGVIITPVLVATLIPSAGSIALEPNSILNIVFQLLVPFVLGQFSRRWSANIVYRYAHLLKWFDQGVIVLVVYLAFSAGMREGIWQKISFWQLIFLIMLCLSIVLALLWITWLLAKWLGFCQADQIAIQFCGTKKSLATGVPMATILFTGQPVGLIVLPLMIFHQLQLLVCSALASHYAAKALPKT